jgi:hypothetical protein
MGNIVFDWNNTLAGIYRLFESVTTQTGLVLCGVDCMTKKGKWDDEI